MTVFKKKPIPIISYRCRFSKKPTPCKTDPSRTFLSILAPCPPISLSLMSHLFAYFSPSPLSPPPSRRLLSLLGMAAAAAAPPPPHKCLSSLSLSSTAPSLSRWRREGGSGRWQREGGGGRCRRQWAAAVGGETAAVDGTLPSTNSGGRGGSGSGNAPGEAHKFLQYG